MVFLKYRICSVEFWLFYNYYRETKRGSAYFRFSVAFSRRSYSFILFVFVVSITDSYRKNRLKIIIAAIAGLLFLIIAPTKLFINDVIPKSFFNFVPDAGPLYIYFTIYFFILVLYALYIIFRKYLESADLVEKNRFKYMILLPWLVFPEEEVFSF